MQRFSFQELIDHTICITGYDGDETTVVIPTENGGAPITAISDGVFKGHPEITSVILPDSVTYIGGFVFDGCTGLRGITLPAALTDIFQYAFARSGLEEIVLPEGVASLPPFVFKDCQSLRRVVCPPGLRRIHAWAFQGCDPAIDIVHGPDTDVSPDAFAAPQRPQK